MWKLMVFTMQTSGGPSCMRPRCVEWVPGMRRRLVPRRTCSGARPVSAWQSPGRTGSRVAADRGAAEWPWAADTTTVVTERDTNVHWFSQWCLVLGRKLHVKCDSLMKGVTLLCKDRAAVPRQARGDVFPSTSARTGVDDFLLFFLLGFLHGVKFSSWLIVSQWVLILFYMRPEMCAVSFTTPAILKYLHLWCYKRC